MTNTSSPYDIMGKLYDKKSRSSIYNAYYERPNLFATLPDIEGKHILDAGCGSGTLTEELLARGASPIVGIDFSKELLQIAKQKYGDKVEFSHADLSKPLDFIADDTFDIIVSSLTFHYINDWQRMFAEFSRILSPTGKIIFSTHHPSASKQWFELENYFEKKLCSEYWNIDGEKIQVSYYHRSLSTMINSFRQNGFFIDKFVEPKPVEKVKEIDPRTYDKLSKNEHFVIFRLQRCK